VREGGPLLGTGLRLLDVAFLLAARCPVPLVAGFLGAVFFRGCVATITCSLEPKRPTSLARLR